MAITCCLYWKKRFLSSSLKLLGGIIGLASVFVSGFLQVLRKTDIRRQDHISQIEAPIEFYKAIIAGNPVEKPNSWKFQAIVSRYARRGSGSTVGPTFFFIFRRKIFLRLNTEMYYW